jgi:two-component system, oxyanion-binding sensor
VERLIGLFVVPGRARKNDELKIGFVPLLDAAPLVAAFELGYFTDEGLIVRLERQIGWGNVRDKLTFGQLHGSQALLGMPAASVLRWPRYPEPLVGLLSLGFGGNAITISRRLFESGVQSGTSLAEWIGRLPRGASAPMFSHVFSCSTHHYLLRDWLSKSEINPETQVRLCVLPPPQMMRQMGNGYIDGFCVGEPWNTAAEIEGCGKVVALTTDIVPAHPEKVFAVTRRWLAERPQDAERAVRALMRGGDFCGDGKNRLKLVEMLAQPKYLDIDAETLSRSFALGGQEDQSRGKFYEVSAAGMFPSATHVGWLLSQMTRWGHLPADVDAGSIAARSVESSVYRAVAAEMGIECAGDDFPPMRLRNGSFVMSVNEQLGSTR